MKYLLPVLLVVAAALVLGGLSTLARLVAPPAQIEELIPGNNPPPIDTAIPEEYLIMGVGAAAPEIAGEYPAYRGARGDAVIDTGLTYDLDWKSNPPQEQWNATLGWGHSGFAVRDGKVYIQDYELGVKPEESQLYIVFRSGEDLADFETFLGGFTFDDAVLQEAEEVYTEERRHTWEDPAEGDPLPEEVKAEAKKDFEKDLRRELVICKKFSPDKREKEYPKTFFGVTDLPAFLTTGFARGMHYNSKNRDLVDWIVRIWQHRSSKSVERIYGYEDMVRCLSLKDGQELWRNCYYEKLKPNHGVSRGTPSVTADRVVALGPNGLLVCLDAHTGRRLWVKDIRAEFGSKIPDWMGAQSPLIVDNPVKPGKQMILLAPCGTEGGQKPGLIMTAMDLENGEFIWGAANKGMWKLSHATPVLMDIDGQQAAVYCAQGGVVAVKVKGGTILWSTDLWQVKTATVTVPVDCGDGRIFFSGGYKSGSKMLQWYREGEGYAVRELWSLPPDKDGFECEQHGPLLIDGFLYGINTNSKSHALVCIDPDAGKVLWDAGKEHSEFYLSPYFAANGHVWALEDESRNGKPARLVVFKVSKDGYEVVAEMPCTKGEKAFGMMTLAGDRLLARDQEFMQCFQLKVLP